MRVPYCCAAVINSMDKLLEYAFGRAAKDGVLYLPGVVSRKKQLIPALMNGLQLMQQG